MSDDLAERLEQLAGNTGKMTWANDTPVPAAVVLRQAAAEIRSLREQVAKAEAAEARARLEGAEVMREAAARAYEAETETWKMLPQRGSLARQGARTIRNLDPAAILSEHARRKAMDELIAGDAEGIVYVTKHDDSDTAEGRDRPYSKLLDEVEFEIRMWDSDRDLTQAELAQRLFDIICVGVGVVVVSDHPNLA